MSSHACSVIVIVCLSFFLLISAWKDNSVLDIYFKPIHRSKCAAGCTHTPGYLMPGRINTVNVPDLEKKFFLWEGIAMNE